MESLAIIGYARVSTGEQADSLHPQVARLVAAGCTQVFSDIESGRSTDRDGLLDALDLIRAGQVTELLVTRVDRLGRDAAYTDATLAQCEASGVTVRALDGGTIETATPQGFLMARLQTGLAEMESRMLSLRIRRQFDVYRAEGRHLRRRKPFGYRAGAGHHLEPHPDQWPQALRVIDELRAAKSFTAVSYALPSWCSWTPAPTNLQSWFCNPVIRGHIPHLRDPKSGKGWSQRWGEIHYDQHPALISEADWHELAEVLRRPRNNFKRTATQHGLTGLLTCASCGHLMRRNTSAGVAWWRCRHRLCTARGGAKEEQILPVVITACVEQAHRLAAALAAPPSDDPALAAMLQELDEMERLAARNPTNRAMAAAVSEQRQQIEGLRRTPAPPIDPAAYQALQDPQFFAGATADQQRAMFQAVLRTVTVGPGGQPLLAQPRS